MFLNLVLVSVAPVIVVHSATVVTAGIGPSLDVDIHLMDPQLLFANKPFLTLVALKLFVLLFGMSIPLVSSQDFGRFEYFGTDFTLGTLRVEVTSMGIQGRTVLKCLVTLITFPSLGWVPAM